MLVRAGAMLGPYRAMGFWSQDSRGVAPGWYVLSLRGGKPGSQLGRIVFPGSSGVASSLCSSVLGDAMRLFALCS